MNEHYRLPDIGARWLDHDEIENELVSDGWKSPRTYGREFESVGNFPAVYLFLLIETREFSSALVAYVGQSLRVKSRWSGHSVLRDLDVDGYFAKPWFKPTKPELLVSLEFELIQRYDPPWNIQGRSRGLKI